MNPNDGLKPLPKPVRLDPKKDNPTRKVAPVQRTAPRDTRPDATLRRTPFVRPEPMRRDTAPRPVLPKADMDLRYFENAQRSHGHKRPLSKPPRKNNKPLGAIGRGLGYVCLGGILIALLVMGGILMTSNNAIAVYLGETRIGYLPLNRETREWNPEDVQQQAITHRERTLVAEIRVNEQVSLTPVRVNRREITNVTITEIISQVSAGFTYQVMATAIYIHGEQIAIMRTQLAAEHVENWFLIAFRNENTIEAFIEGWELRNFLVPDEGWDTDNDAIERLDRQVEAVVGYVVQDGDTKGAIALRHGIPFNRLLEDNNLEPEATIRPGNIIYIRSTRPFLSVRTIEEVTREEITPVEIETRYNYQLAAGDINVIQEGREGLREVTLRITYVNGQPESEEAIRVNTLQEPELRIVEVGTAEDVIPPWR